MTENKKLDYIEAGHRYFFDKTEITSVSKILEKFYPFNHGDVKKMEKGKNIHKCLELWDMDKLNIPKSHGYYLRYITGWEKFKLDYNLIDLPCLIEAKAVDPLWMYAGRIDRIFIDQKNKIVYIVDIKTGHIREKRDPLQLYGYAQLIYPLITKYQNLSDWEIHDKFKGKLKLEAEFAKGGFKRYIFKLYDCYLSNNATYKPMEARNVSRGIKIFLYYTNVYNHMGGLNG